ncbi:MAG: GNAT family N-acetyltransferase [Anaerolineales bacterium]|nr:GNAT family N-acetyltransferase [Anaerolineales bacterium]
MVDRSIIRPLETIEDMAQVEELQRLVWPGSETDIVPSHLMLTIAHNGGVILGAFEGNRLVGFVFGFLGTDAQSPDRVAMARLKHCSHQLGVHPDYRNRGLGYRLKVAQREAVLKDGIRLVTWTYDPLLSHNAHLNIRLLGAVSRVYYRNLYGTMRDGLNIGLPSDRFQVEWWITSSRVQTRIEGSRGHLDLAHFLSAGAQKINFATLDDRGLLIPPDEWSIPESNLLLVEIPHEYIELKQQDLELGYTWRIHTREVFESVFTAGYLVTDFIYLKEEQYPRSYYLLTHGDSRLG